MKDTHPQPILYTRVTRTLHERLFQRAHEERTSMNKLVVRYLTEALDYRDTNRRRKKR